MHSFFHVSVRSLVAVLAAAIFLITVQAAQAQTFYLTGGTGGVGDPGNSSSFNNSGLVPAGFSSTGATPGVAAVAGNNYIVAGSNFSIRTPVGNSPFTFAGLSLASRPPARYTARR